MLFVGQSPTIYPEGRFEISSRGISNLHSAGGTRPAVACYRELQNIGLQCGLGKDRQEV